MKLFRNALGERRSRGALRAVWNGAVLAESSRTVVVEGNHYFGEDVNWDLLEPDERRTYCPWKGEADYLTAVVGDRRGEAVAWRYRSPKPAVAEIEDRLAFWGDVRVEEG